MSIGMTYEQYWDGDCQLTKYYRKADELRLQRQNQLLHLQGAYIYEILLDVVPAFRTFSKTPPKEYRKDVIPITPTENEMKEKREEKMKLEKSAAAMMQIMTSINGGRHGDRT